MSAIEPALTSKEWASFKALPKIDYTDFPEELERAHRAAAKHLHEQPFGFRREDVELLGNVHSNHFGCDENVCWAVDLADRISALLPPEEK